jgi:hypothetical protein
MQIKTASVQIYIYSYACILYINEIIILTIFHIIIALVSLVHGRCRRPVLIKMKNINKEMKQNDEMTSQLNKMNQEKKKAHNSNNYNNTTTKYTFES